MEGIQSSACSGVEVRMNVHAMSPILEAVNLAKSYDEGGVELMVFSGLNFRVERGERVAIIGASGSGKSTLLHILGGLDAPTDGKVRVGGVVMSSLTDSARGRLRNQVLGFVYQFHHLLPEFTALENVAMPLSIRRVPSREATRIAAALLGRVGLGGRLRHKPSELSGGERQRAAVARALVTRPACVLADEPTGNLDAKTADNVFGLMLELNRDLGTTLIVATHDSGLAARMDRVLNLESGQLRSGSFAFK